MISIGNDIVSLEPACHRRFSQKEYYSKILSVKEKNYFSGRLEGNFSFAHYVWLLWSIKEAVYKYFKRLDSELLFNPFKIAVDDILFQDDYFYTALRNRSIESTGFLRGGFIDGHITLRDNNICSKLIMAKDFIFSVAADEKHLKDILWGIQKIDNSDYNSQSKAVRTFTAERLKNMMPDTEMTIAKNDVGVPYLLFNDRLCPVSFTHDRQYMVYSFLLQKSAYRISPAERV